MARLALPASILALACALVVVAPGGVTAGEAASASIARGAAAPIVCTLPFVHQASRTDRGHEQRR